MLTERLLIDIYEGAANAAPDFFKKTHVDTAMRYGIMGVNV